jgi:sarcosine oxidase
VYIWDLGSRGNFYGFPEQSQFAASGVKVAFHSVREGDITKKRLLLRPEDVQREVTDEDIGGLREVLQRKMPALNGELLETATCMYTMTPDEHL